MLLFVSPLARPQKDETPGEGPERLVRLVAGGCNTRVGALLETRYALAA